MATSNEKLIKLIQAEIDGKEVQEQYTSRSHGGNVNRSWEKKLKNSWHTNYTYRIKPEEPREWYVNEYEKIFDTKGFGYLHETRELAEKHKDTGVINVLKVREVLD